MDAGMDAGACKDRMSPDEVVAVARLCRAVYLETTVVFGWRAVSAEDLGLSGGMAAGCRFVNRNAVAFVREAEVRGRRTLAVTFKGTDALSMRDWRDNILDINRHYDLMHPLVSAVDAYVRSRDVSRVIAAGHSLGGAMAALYMQEHGAGREGPTYLGCTFGSPGARFDRRHRDGRLVEFRHAEDLVPRMGQARRLFTDILPPYAYKAPGRAVTVDVVGAHEDALGPVVAHRMDEYVKTAVLMRRSGVLDGILRGADDRLVRIDGRDGRLLGPAGDADRDADRDALPGAAPGFP